VGGARSTNLNPQVISINQYLYLVFFVSFLCQDKKEHNTFVILNLFQDLFFTFDPGDKNYFKNIL